MWKTIQKSATKLTNIPYNLAGSHNNTFTRVACRVPLKLANDGSGKHTHVAEQTCILDNCENKICEKLCADPNTFKIKGHNTHKPVIGRLTRFISAEDANGDPKKQYFVPCNERKQLTEAEKQAYGNKIKNDPKQQEFIETHQDKYNE